MLFEIPYKDRGRIYQKVADEVGVSVQLVSLVNNERKQNMKVMENLIYEFGLYERKKARLMKKINDNKQRKRRNADDLPRLHS